jgi:hypothetical protein
MAFAIKEVLVKQFTEITMPNQGRWKLEPGFNIPLDVHIWAMSSLSLLGHGRRIKILRNWIGYLVLCDSANSM